MKCAPIVLIIYNRPEMTRRIWDVIKGIEPLDLLVLADGPRDNEIDRNRCSESRQIIDPQWDCRLQRHYQDANLGCAQHIAYGLDRVFHAFEEAIILEDDCLPSPSFFAFASALLEHYRDDHRIGQICGTTKICSSWDVGASYFFSRYGPVWGWASWRRAWKYYDLKMLNWFRFKRRHSLGVVFSREEEVQWRNATYDQLHRVQFTWDYQWQFAKIAHSMLSIMPAVNLVENIGNPDHTAKRMTMQFPLAHPEFIYPDHSFDLAYSKVHWPAKS